MAHEDWPALSYGEWKETYATLHMWTQVVGKIALALAPPMNHSWGVALQVTPRGLSTRTLPHGSRSFVIAFDFVDHSLQINVSDGRSRVLPLGAQTVAAFYRTVMGLLDELGLHVKIWTLPSEVPNPIRFEQDV